MLMWFRVMTGKERRSFYSAFLGHVVDVFDFMIYSFLIPTLLAQWNMSRSEAGAIVTYTLVSSLLGAIIAGSLADRYGRVRVLRWTIVVFAVASFLCGVATSPTQLMAFRVVQGLGYGGESAICMVLVMESIRNPEHRGKYSGFTSSSYSFGWGAAVLAYAGAFSVLPPDYAWRACFLLSIVPAALVIYLRRNLVEPEIHLDARAYAQKASMLHNLRRVFSRALLGRTILCSLLSGGMLGGYYAIATWLPTYLKTERGLSLFGTSSYLVVTIVGSFVGYILGAYATDRLGRRWTYAVFAIAALAMALAYMGLPVSNTAMLFLSFPLGIGMQGMFSGVGASISEAFPSSVRATGHSVSYNAGRVIGSLFPLLVGWLSARQLGLGMVIALSAGAGYLVVVVAAILLPETNGIDLSLIEDEGRGDVRDGQATSVPAEAARG